MKWLLYTVLIFVFAGCKKDNDSPSMGDNKLSIDSVKVLDSNIPDNVYWDLTFTNANTGYALSDKLVARTIDGGLSWDSILLPMEKAWRKIQFTDANHGYIIGNDNMEGYLLKTVDGGQTWELIDLDVQENPRGMHFLDNNTGFITGNWFFRKTTDGGHTWTNVGHQQKIYLDVKFRNALVGYATTSYRGTYFKTVDGGNTWDSLQYRNKTPFTHIHYTDNLTLMETSNDSVIDLSNSFSSMKVPYHAQKLLFIDANHSVGIGWHYELNYALPWADLFVTNNGWKTFQRKKLPDLAIRFTAIARMSTNKLMILGSGFEGTKVLELEW
jgi:hypothetical protein